jgi:hypothetical protein
MSSQADIFYSSQSSSMANKTLSVDACRRQKVFTRADEKGLAVLVDRTVFAATAARHGSSS